MEVPNETAPSVQQRPPPLSIAHLLVWTALAAVLMCWMTWLARLQGLAPGPTQLAWRVLIPMTGGANLGGLLLLLVWRIRRIPFPVAPGEWLLVSQGLSLLLAVPIESAFTCCFVTNVGSWQLFALIYEVTMSLVAVLPFALPAVLCRERGIWKLFFWAAAILEILSAAISLLPGSFTAVSPLLWAMVEMSKHLLIAAILAWAIIDDRRRHRTRTWTHWAGLMTLGADIGAHLVNEALIGLRG